MKKKQIILSAIIIVLIIVPIIFVFFRQKADVILFEYEKPSWLTGHIKESTIETYIDNQWFGQN